MLVKINHPIMKKTLHITASFDQPELVENIAEKLASRHYDYGYTNIRMQKGWKAIATSTVENYVSGTIEIATTSKEKIKVPFTSCFLFSCIKEKSQPYDLCWSASFN